MEEISWSDFEKVCLKVGTVLDVLDFPEAKKPAFTAVERQVPNGSSLI